MTEELRPGFQIKTAAHKAIANDDDVAEAVLNTIARLDIGPPRDRGAAFDDRDGDIDTGFDPGFDTRDSYDDGLF
ncbi:hypothetical protein [Pseudodonghicola flavimaris]|uniref:Uncharacterized protein n=1 Tax=Pseudodonghicola flavimaris TaxID=3050036 RepID=A0ABT7F1V3_9RHOB|nr:hypothetical protein [Pseudodonghicola flavimaris]MDK3018587.1 hypothetical protein [Pseudodonghicola flavimaris]